MLQCSMGTTPSSLMVVNPMRPMIQQKPKATIADMIPMTNILPFGMCRSLLNPTVASATAAAMGALTPMPCVPLTTIPWAPGGQQLITNIPALEENCQCMCSWGGTISIKSPGHTEMTDGK